MLSGAVKETDPAKVQALADRLDTVVRDDTLGRPGLFGRKLFPDHRIVARSLVLQLNRLAAHQRLVNRASIAVDSGECQDLLYDYCDAYLSWDTAHGWHELWGWDTWPLGMDTIEKPFVISAQVIVEMPRQRCKCRGLLRRGLARLCEKHDKAAVEVGCVAVLNKELHAAIPIVSLAQSAKVMASAVPDRKRSPPEASVDGYLATLYWPGALTTDNVEWLELSWDKPQTISKVVVRFLPHPSMPGRTIHLQRQDSGKWVDFATTIVPATTTRLSRRCDV